MVLKCAPTAMSEDSARGKVSCFVVSMTVYKDHESVSKGGASAQTLLFAKLSSDLTRNSLLLENATVLSVE